LATIPEPFRLGANAVTHWAKLGYAPNDALMLGVLSLSLNILQATSNQLSETLSSDQDQWKPLWHSNDVHALSLEVYYLKVPPQPWCAGQQPIDAKGQYCPAENRIYASSSEITRPELDPSSVTTETNLSAALLHELGHVFLNPKVSFDAPFIAEGIVTAGAEESVRSTNAAVRFHHKLSTHSSIASWMNSQIKPNAPVDSPELPPRIAQQLTQTAFSEIGTEPFTRYQEAALCLLHSKPMNAAFIEKELSFSNNSFRAQKPEEIYGGYAAAWAIFHYGTGILGKKLAVDQEYNTQILLKVAEEIVHNAKPPKEELAALAHLVTQVQQKVDRTVESKRVRCLKGPKEGRK
jgi:hypothetical protein